MKLYIFYLKSRNSGTNKYTYIVTHTCMHAHIWILMITVCQYGKISSKLSSPWEKSHLLSLHKISATDYHCPL